MKRFAVLTISAVVLVQFAGCRWFIFPGQAISNAYDKATGAEGDHCAPLDVKVGDALKLPGGGIVTIKSVSGRSMRCTNEAFPIRVRV